MLSAIKRDSVKNKIHMLNYSSSFNHNFMWSLVCWHVFCILHQPNVLLSVMRVTMLTSAAWTDHMIWYVKTFSSHIHGEKCGGGGGSDLSRSISLHSEHNLDVFCTDSKQFLEVSVISRIIKVDLTVISQSFFTESKQYKVCEIDRITIRNNALRSYMTWLPVISSILDIIIVQSAARRCHRHSFRKFTVVFRPIRKQIVSSMHKYTYYWAPLADHIGKTHGCLQFPKLWRLLLLFPMQQLLFSTNV